MEKRRTPRERKASELRARARRDARRQAGLGNEAAADPRYQPPADPRYQPPADPRYQPPADPRYQPPADTRYPSPVPAGRFDEQELYFEPSPGQTTLFVIAAALATLGISWAVGWGAGTLFDTKNALVLGFGGAVAVGGTALMWRLWHVADVRAVYTSSILAAVLVALFSWGAVTSVVIEGKVYPSTSQTAHIYHATQEMWTDLRRIAQADPLLVASGADARAYFQRYQPEANALGEISKKWAKRAYQNELPAPGLVEAAKQLAAAADWGSRALVRKAQDTLEPDPRAESDVAAWTGAYREAGAAAGETVARVAALYNFRLASVSGVGK